MTIFNVLVGVEIAERGGFLAPDGDINGACPADAVIMKSKQVIVMLRQGRRRAARRLNDVELCRWRDDKAYWIARRKWRPKPLPK